MPRILLTAALLVTLPLALPSTLTAQDDKPKTDSGASKVVAGVNTDVIAARKANEEHRYGDAEALMLKDLADHPAMAIPRVELALAEMGMEKYDDAALNFKKALGIDFKIDASSSSDNFYPTSGTSEIQATRASRNTAGGDELDLKKNDPEVLGAAWNGLG
jgi:hypothetical protein